MPGIPAATIGTVQGVPEGLAAHHRALASRGRCPACAERLPAPSLFRGEPCPACGAQLAQFRLYGHDVARELERRGQWGLIALIVIVAVVHLILGWVPLLDALVIAGAAIWIRIGLLNPVTHTLSPRRRLLTRWTARLLMGSFLAFTLVFSQLLTLLPFISLPAKAALGAIEVAGAAGIVTAYTHWQLRRERDGRDVAAWEWVLLVGSVVTLLLMVAALTYAIIMLVGTLDAWISALAPEGGA